MEENITTVTQRATDTMSDNLAIQDDYSDQHNWICVKQLNYY